MSAPLSRTHRDRLSAGYLAAQAVAVVVWWSALGISSSIRRPFELDSANRDVLNAFILGDVLILFAGSSLAAVATWRQWARRRALVAWVAGGVGYATLTLVAWIALGGRGGAGLVLMAASTVMTTGIAVSMRTERD